MPPLRDEEPYPPHSRRRNRPLRCFTWPISPTSKAVHEESDDDDGDGTSSDDNVSPDAGKSEIRFTLQRKQATTDDSRSNGRNKSRSGDWRGSSGRNSGHSRAIRADSFGNRRDGNPITPAGDHKGDPSNGHGKGGEGKGGGTGQGNGGGEPGNVGGGGPGNGRGGPGDRGSKNHGDGDNGDNGSDNSDDDDNSNDDDNKDGGGSGDENNGSGGNSKGSDPHNSPPPPPPPPPPLSPSPTQGETTVSATPTDKASTETSAESRTHSTRVSKTETPTTAAPLVTAQNPIAPAPSATSLNPPEVAQPSSVVSATPVAPLTESAVSSGIPTSTSSSSITIPASEAPVPAQTIPPNTIPPNGGSDFPDGNNRHGGNGGKGGMNGFPSGHGRFNGLDPTTERVLIITGSIGIVVILCFISWLVFRNMKRANATGPRRGSRKWLPKWLPWGRKPADDRIKPALAFYTTKGMEAPFLAYDSRELDSPHTISYYGEPKLHPTVSERTTNATTEIFRNGLAIRQSTEPQSLLPYRLVGPKLQINGQIMDTSIIDHPTPSQKANAYYNQSGPAGPQSLDAYNSPTQTQRYPASEVSSLSSGFGDGDIIVTHSNTVVVKPPMAAVRGTETEAEMESEMGNSRRGSWASSSGSVMKRYSVHTTTTTTSDRPARFRSIHSWVNQQKARLKRADSRGQSEQKGAPNAAAT